MDKKEVKKYHYYTWQDGFLPNDMLIQSGKYTDFYFYWYFEYDFSITNETAKFINDNNIKINLITCSADLDWLTRRLTDVGVRNELLRVEIWPGYWFMKSHFNIIRDNSFLYSTITSNKNFLYPFLCFNGRTNHHRSTIVDQLVKRNYLDKGIVTYHMMGAPDDDFNWKYHNGTPITIDDGFTTDPSSYKFDKRFLQSFLHIPTETDVNVVLISEKTATPILCGLPFLTLGAPGFHQKLKDLGFELYTEIFDYSFDEVESLDLRIALILKNVKFVIDNFHRIDILYKSIEHKIERNKNHAKTFFQSWDTIPHLIKERYEDIVSWNTDLISECDFVLIEEFREIKNKEIIKRNFYGRPFRFKYNFCQDFEFSKIIQEIEQHKPLNITIFVEDESFAEVTPEFEYVVNKYNIEVTVVKCSCQK
jgi:hypothetical protein